MDTPTTQHYPLSLHDALPISVRPPLGARALRRGVDAGEEALAVALDRLLDAADVDEVGADAEDHGVPLRSEEHTSELQSQFHIVCRLLLEKKKLLRVLTTVRS